MIARSMSRRHKPHLRCPDCRQHLSVCVCALLPRIETRTHVVLIVHQLEARKPTNTGLLAARCLPGSTVVYRGRAVGDGRVAGAAPGWPAGAQPLLLYPHPDATPLEAWRGAPSPLALLVPDGTWRQAARARAQLADVPCVALPGARATGARLRTPARLDRLATLEALALALGVLEGPDIERALLHVFRVVTERTLWTKGRLPAEAVTGGIPAGARPHDPLGKV
jgi:DTW domain-containing protein YfiP